MCFSIGWLEHLLIWLVVIGIVVAIVRLLLPHILGMLGVAGGLIAQILGIVCWGLVLIAVIVFAFDLVACVLPIR